MKRTELEKIRRNYFNSKGYKMQFWRDYNYRDLSYILYAKRAGKGDHRLYNDCIMMLDTETSKKDAAIIGQNHIVTWCISIRAFHLNIVTLWGYKPSECVECIKQIHEHLPGELSYIYIHNMSYDWVFLRKFFLREFEQPVRQLNTKSLYPIYIEFPCGVVLRDSLILAQRKLEKWAKDMDVEHQKAVGFWDYDKLRNQGDPLSDQELKYIENDTLAGVECIDATLQLLHKRIYSIPWTATGIPREEVRKRGKDKNAHEKFLKQAPEWELQKILELVYHGGYTHGNRHYYNQKITGLTSCYDFASSYPFVMLSEKYPAERFTPMGNRSISDILKDADNNAYFFKLILIGVELKDYYYPMPALQFSKAVKCINPVLDNGRILTADYIEIWLTETDLKVIAAQYKYQKHLCVNVYAAHKDYLPKWFTDYIFELFKDKTKLKGGDPVLYALRKATLNSIYGMTVQKPVKDTIAENYETGEYEVQEVNPEAEYAKYIKRFTSVLNYQIGVWVTAYAFRNLFDLGSCCRDWIYSDTDSCYGQGWDKKKLEAYNNRCKEKLLKNGYGPVQHNGRDYWLGVAEPDGDYTEFKVIGAKRYCGRSAEDGKLHITVAGVPKIGAECLDDNIDNFRTGFIFPGTRTGKKTHTHFYIDDIYIDENGNETGDSIDLSPCDYLLGGVADYSNIFKEEVKIQVYE